MVADKVGFALAPDAGLGKRGNWLWAWALGIPAGTKHAAEAQKFIDWATSKHYLELRRLAERLGRGPARHAHLALREPRVSEGGVLRQGDARLDQLGRPEPSDGEAGALYGRAVRCDSRVPGHSATKVGELFSAALAGQMSADDALKQAQDYVKTQMTKAGYIK